MKGPLVLDRSRHDFGAAAPAVLRILSDWEGIDWFVPATQPGSAGTAHLLDHQRWAHEQAPQRFAQHIDVQHRRGGWPEFTTCCQSVRGPTASDWKFGPLKDLTQQHNQRCGFSLAEAGPRTLRPGAAFDAGCLVFPLNGTILWGPLGPQLDFRQLDPTAADSAAFYFMYARGDALDAVQWQLAEPHAPLEHNPFWALLRCYASGYYPFAYDQTRFILFRFDF